MAPGDRLPRTGLLLVNLGTPDAPRAPEVRRYLRQFLNDPRVIDIPAIARWLLVNAIILPFRPRKSAAALKRASSITDYYAAMSVFTRLGRWGAGGRAEEIRQVYSGIPII